jgi:hypothetical protein
MQLDDEQLDLKGLKKTILSLPIVIDTKKIGICASCFSNLKENCKKKTLLKSFTIQFVFFLFDFLMIEFETKVF